MVTILAWFVELVGFTTVFIGTHILGHENNVINLLLKTITNLIYFILVPSILMIHQSDFKSRIVEKHYFESCLAIFNLQYKDEDTEDDGEHVE